MERFVVRKNTLPYIHQWAVLDMETGNKVGEYKTKKLAEKACNGFKQHGLPNDTHGVPLGFERACDVLNKRMKRPEGDPSPKPPKHSDKRPVELD